MRYSGRYAPWAASGRGGVGGDQVFGPPWSRRKRRHADWPPGAAIIAAIFHLAGTRDLAERGGVHLTPTPLVVTLLLIGPIVLLWRRRAPMTVFAVAALASLAVAAGSSPHWIYAVAPGMALFHLARLGRRTAAGIAAAVTWTVWALTTAVLAGPLGLNPGVRPDVRELLLAAAAMAGTVLLGTVSKARGEHLAVLARAQEEQDRARAEQKRRQESEERLRMAQELHDVLGHHLSLINVQAGVGLHLMDSRPEQARDSLTAIKTASAEALREVRSVLGVLRTENEPAPRQPSPGLSRLPDLTTDPGFPVTTHVEGAVRPLPPEVDRAAYRIVQEALTNVRRHAAPSSSVRLELAYTPTTLTVTITDSGASAPPPPEPEDGNGLSGMRARAENLGGRFSAAPQPSGGFRVTATLPIPPSPGSAPPPPFSGGVPVPPDPGGAPTSGDGPVSPVPGGGFASAGRAGDGDDGMVRSRAEEER